MSFEIIHGRIGSDIWANTRLQVIRKLIKDRGKRILDLGCGKGYIGKSLQNQNSVIFGELDYNEIKDMRGDKVILDARRLPFLRESFSYVICGDVLEHIKDDERVLKEIYSVLKWQGRAIIAVPAYSMFYGHHDRLLGHYRRYDSADFIKKARDAGFKIKYARYLCSILFFPFLLNQFMIKSNKAYIGKSKLEGRLKSLLSFLCSIESSLKLPFGIGLIFVLEK